MSAASVLPDEGLQAFSGRSSYVCLRSRCHSLALVVLLDLNMCKSYLFIGRTTSRATELQAGLVRLSPHPRQEVVLEVATSPAVTTKRSHPVVKSHEEMSDSTK